MIWIVLLLVYVYWITESFSESFTWLASWHSTKPIIPKTYHLVRLPETLSIIISHLILGYLLKAWHGVLMVSLVEIMGCILYERIYCAMNYDDFWYSKTSKWLFCKHPKSWMEVVLFVISFIILICII